LKRAAILNSAGVIRTLDPVAAGSEEAGKITVDMGFRPQKFSLKRVSRPHCRRTGLAFGLGALFKDPQTELSQRPKRCLVFLPKAFAFAAKTRVVYAGREI
jgi:hypothetical protein